MLDIFFERFRQKKRTVAYPDALPTLPPRFRGRPVIDAACCAAASGCTACATACPVGAIGMDQGAPVLDTGVCTFCGDCALACRARGGREALVFTTDWRLASTSREGLLVRPRDLAWTGPDQSPVVQSFPEPSSGRGLALEALPPPVLTPFSGGGAFKRSLRLRQVSAAGCGACEGDLNVLGTVVFDLGRFGIDFVASPRHADALVVTGTVPRNMRDGLRLTDQATPAPKAVVAAGACAISGGLFRALPDAACDQHNEGATALLPVDLYIPGCPPHPYTNLDALLSFAGLDVAGR